MWSTVLGVLDPCCFYCMLMILVVVFPVQLLNYLQMILTCSFMVNLSKICKLLLDLVIIGVICFSEKCSGQGWW